MKLLSKKTPKETLLPLMDKVLEATIAVRKFQSKNERIFTAYHELVEAQEVAENELRTATKQLGVGYETESVACEYVMPRHKYYDPTVLREQVSAKILDALGVIEKKETVNEKLLKMLVKAKKIKKSIMEAAYREEPTGSPRVTITIKDVNE